MIVSCISVTGHSNKSTRDCTVSILKHYNGWDSNILGCGTMLSCSHNFGGTYCPVFRICPHFPSTAGIIFSRFFMLLLWWYIVTFKGAISALWFLTLSVHCISWSGLCSVSIQQTSLTTFLTSPHISWLNCYWTAIDAEGVGSMFLKNVGSHL